MNNFRTLEEITQITNAYEYYAALSGLFLSLKDPHTLFVKPQFYKNFKMYFPFMFENEGGRFFATPYPNGTSYKTIADLYE